MDSVRRVLRPDGVLFLNLGDTYYNAKGRPHGVDRKSRHRRFGLRAVDAGGLGVPRKTIIGIPWRVALEMINRGWILRAPIIWQRNSALPEPTAKDRPWRTYEFLFMFSKSPRYHFSRSELPSTEDIWNIPVRPSTASRFHSASYPAELVETCLKIACPAKGEILDPFAGSGVTLLAALKRGHPAFGIDIKHDYCQQMVSALNRF
jgi:DNA modification methylase